MNQEKRYSLKHYLQKLFGFKPKYKREKAILESIMQEEKAELEKFSKKYHET